MLKFSKQIFWQNYIILPAKTYSTCFTESETVSVLITFYNTQIFTTFNFMNAMKLHVMISFMWEKQRRGTIWQTSKHMKRSWEQKKLENRNNHSDPFEWWLLLLAFYYCGYFPLTQFLVATNNYIICPEGANSIFWLWYPISKVILILSISNTCQRIFFFSHKTFIFFESQAIHCGTHGKVLLLKKHSVCSKKSVWVF